MQKKVIVLHRGAPCDQLPEPTNADKLLSTRYSNSRLSDVYFYGMCCKQNFLLNHYFPPDGLIAPGVTEQVSVILCTNAMKMYTRWPTITITVSYD